VASATRNLWHVNIVYFHKQSFNARENRFSQVAKLSHPPAKNFFGAKKN
jgi:hypothetical protein